MGMAKRAHTMKLTKKNLLQSMTTFFAPTFGFTMAAKSPLAISADEAWELNELGMQAEFVTKKDLKQDMVEAGIDGTTYSMQLLIADSFVLHSSPKHRRR